MNHTKRRVYFCIIGERQPGYDGQHAKNVQLLAAGLLLVTY